MTFDFTKQELLNIIEEANFTDVQLEIFNRLTDRHGRQPIFKIAMEMNLSESTVSREIKKIKNKIIKII